MDTAGRISIHHYNDHGFQRLIDLSRTTYADREISNHDYLNWEYAKNPDGVAIINVAEADGETISQYIVLPRSFVIKGVIVKGSLSVNTLTHPAFRGHAIFPRLTAETFKRCREKEILFTIGFPNPVSSPVIRRKKIFSHIGALSLLIKPLHPFSAIFTYLTGRKHKSGTEIELHVPIRYYDEHDNISPLDFSTDAPRYEKFHSGFSLSKNIVTDRSWNFLKWRYSAIPLRKYLLLKYVIEGEINAVVVLRARYMFGLRCLIVIDLMTGENRDIAKPLLAFIRRIALYNNLHLIIAALPSHCDEYHLLKKRGYFNAPERLLPQQLDFIIKTHLDGCPPEVTDFRNWFLTFGDYDIF